MGRARGQTPGPFSCPLFTELPRVSVTGNRVSGIKPRHNVRDV